MKNLDLQKRWFFIVMMITVIYWSYFILTSHMIIGDDALEYERYGKLLATEGFSGYFSSGPYREPLFPFLVSLSMRLENFLGIPYQVAQKYIHLAIILLTQLLMFVLMRRLRMSMLAIVVVLLYFGISPAVLNSGMSLFSEIAAYPWGLLIVLCVVQAWENRKKSLFQVLMWSVICVPSVMMLIFVKAIFEVGFLLFIIPVFVMAVILWCHGQRRLAVYMFIFAALTSIAVGMFCHGYKSLNKKYNGQYVVARLGHLGLYGNTFRRVQPFKIKDIGAALASVPGDGFCRAIFNDKECSFWSFRFSDNAGGGYIEELSQKGYSANEVKEKLVRESVEMVLERPVQYSMLCLIEGCKVFFWESTQVGFVSYPLWIQKVYAYTPLRKGWRLFMAILTIGGLVFGISYLKAGALDSGRRVVIFWMLWMVLAWCTFYSLFTILTRYIFPIVPILMILIGFALDVQGRRGKLASQ